MAAHILHDPAKCKLGKAAPKHDKRTLQLADYLTGALPAPPAAKDWSAAVGGSWGMMLNDRLGCCTVAAIGHTIQTWTGNAGGQAVTIADADVLKAYEGAAGYNPADPTSDQGAVEVDVLNYYRQVGVAGHKLGAYAAMEPRNRGHIESSLALFGTAYLGIALPQSAQRQRVWSVPWYGPRLDGAPGSWGGHAVNVVGYDAQGLTIVTWGALKRMTWQFLFAYCDEAYCLLDADWFGASSKLSPSGFDLPALQADLALVAH